MTLAKTDTETPRGPDAVVEALLQATEELCQARPPGSVTVRQIAEVAGVNHGLVHHYLESKAALIAATMARVEVQILALVKSIEDPATAIGAFFEAVCDRPTYPWLLSWMLLEGVDSSEYEYDFPLVDHLAELIAAESGGAGARLRTQALLSFTAGWATNHEFTAHAAGLTESERERSHSCGRSQAISIALGPDLLTESKQRANNVG